MSNLAIKQLLFQTQFSIIVICKRGVKHRGPFSLRPRNFEAKNRQYLEAHKNKGLELSERHNMPEQFKLRPKRSEGRITTKEHKLVPLKDSQPPYMSTKPYDLAASKTWFDPLFNPNLHEESYTVNPEEEPFDAIYADSKSELSNEYTKTRNITTPELWEFVERLARIKVAPKPVVRKADEPIVPLASGYVPPPETPPDLPYFIPRTRNYLLPVYYHLDSDPENCYTVVKQVTGDLWKLEQDLRIHLESLQDDKSKRILTSVHEPDERVLFRGKHLHEVAAWLHGKGF